MICVGSTVGCYHSLHIINAFQRHTGGKSPSLHLRTLFHAQYDSTTKCIAATATVPTKFHTTPAECDITRKADAI
jgi:hypothetical protein